jgi:cell division protease FtsH
MDKKVSLLRRLKTFRRPGDIRSLLSLLGRLCKKYGQALLTGVLVFLLLLLLSAILSLLPGPLWLQAPENVTPVTLQTFMSQVKANNVRAVLIRGDAMTAELTRSLQGRPCNMSPTLSSFTTSDFSTTSVRIDPACLIYLNTPPQSNGLLLPPLFRHAVIVDVTPPPPDFPVELRLFCALALLMILLILMSSFLRKSHQPASYPPDRLSRMLKSRARQVGEGPKQSPAQSVTARPSFSGPSALKSVSSTPPTTFADVAGIDEVRAELAEVVRSLRQPECFQRLGAHVPRGILLVGPPGTGKTLLARAVAGEAGVPFLHMSASEFVEMFVGVGASRVRDLFRQARNCAPCVVFLDEIDAVGRKRALLPVDSGERDQTLNQLLIELDGFQSRSGIVLLAATNRVDMLDPALLRPGRFDRQIPIPLPDVRGREAILRVHTRQTPLDARVRLSHLARMSAGMSGAELANLVNEAALCAARRDLSALTPECFAEALARIQLGALRPLVISERERHIIAVHEGGHALVAYYLPEADPVHYLTILAHGRHLGVTQFASEEERYHLSRTRLMARIAVGLGGRVAVELVFGSDGVTTGAEEDLQAATTLARRMVTRWGMGKEVGVVFADYRAPAAERSWRDMPGGTQTVSSRSMEAAIDKEIQCILQDGRQIALRVLSEHSPQLALLAEALIEREQLDREQFEAILARPTSASQERC